MLRYGGESNVPGAPGNRKGILISQAQSGLGPPVGNEGFIPMGPMGMPFPTGPSPEDMQRQAEEQKRQQLEMQKQMILNQITTERNRQLSQPLNYNPNKPFVIEGDVAGNEVTKIGGSTVIQLDPNQRLRIGGMWLPGYQEQGTMEAPVQVPIPQDYRLEMGYETPSVQFNFNYRPRRQGFGGFGANTKFNVPFQ